MVAFALALELLKIRRRFRVVDDLLLLSSFSSCDLLLMYVWGLCSLAWRTFPERGCTTR